MKASIHTVFCLSRISPHVPLPAETKIKAATSSMVQRIVFTQSSVTSELSPVPELLGHLQNTLVASGALQQVCVLIAGQFWQKLPLEWMTRPHSHLGLLRLDDIKLF